MRNLFLEKGFKTYILKNQNDLNNICAIDRNNDFFLVQKITLFLEFCGNKKNIIVPVSTVSNSVTRNLNKDVLYKL